MPVAYGKDLDVGPPATWPRPAPPEHVIYLLEMCLDSDRAKHLKYFIAFLKTSKKVELNHDEWSSFFNFSVHIDLDCGNYEDDGAWPSLLDEYVEWKKEQA